jgi:protein-tyrosine phosphatase
LIPHWRLFTSGSCMDITRVTPNLLVGPAPYDAEEYEELKAKEVTAILSLQTRGDLGDRTPADVRNAAESMDLIFRNVPVTDFDALDLKRQLPACVMALDELVAAGYRVYVHCTAGVTRSPTVIAAYLQWKLNWPLEKALNHLENIRNCCPQGDTIRRTRPIWCSKAFDQNN